jgi:hypothetical protein
MKVLIMQYSLATHLFFSFRSIYSPQLPVLKTPSTNLCSSLCVKDKFSYPNKTDKLMILYILIFKFLETRAEDKSF